MPRVPRIYIENSICYVTSRGDHDEVIFREGGDYQMYLELLKKAKEQYRFKLFAFCLLPNHLHLLIEPDDEGAISQVMHGLNSNYTKYFNGKYSKSGHLFQERYKMALIEKSPNLLNVTAYIHLNPKALGIAAEIKDYPYSSYPAYLNAKTAIINIGGEVREISGYLSGKKYEDFISGIALGFLQDLGKELSKRPIIGSDEFVEKVKNKIESDKLRVAEGSLSGSMFGIMSGRKFLAASGVAIVLLGALTFYLYSRASAFKDNLKNKESEFSGRLLKAKDDLKKDLEGKYRADMVSFEAMTKRLEMEKQKAGELEEQLKSQQP
ncbi:MAG: transposase [Candidatus Omnitrophota bacterium]|nr:transposase [Candidatus Omnitrophota bacterium]